MNMQKITGITRYICTIIAASAGILLLVADTSTEVTQLLIALILAAGAMTALHLWVLNKSVDALSTFAGALQAKLEHEADLVNIQIIANILMLTSIPKEIASQYDVIMVKFFDTCDCTELLGKKRATTVTEMAEVIKRLGDGSYTIKKAICGTQEMIQAAFSGDIKELSEVRLNSSLRLTKADSADAVNIVQMD